MDNLRIFIYLQSQNRKCSSREIAESLNLGIRKTQYILKLMHESGFIDRDNSIPFGYKVKV